jgi:hypothetical protein
VADGIRVILVLPDVAVPGPDAVLRLRSGKKGFRREATVVASDGAAVVDATVGPRRWGRAPWQLAVRLDQDGRFLPVEARLLVAPGQPVALLPGPAPATRMPSPAPGGSPASRVRRLAGRVRRTGRRALRR